MICYVVLGRVLGMSLDMVHFDVTVSHRMELYILISIAGEDKAIYIEIER